LSIRRNDPNTQQSDVQIGDLCLRKDKNSRKINHTKKENRSKLVNNDHFHYHPD